MPQNLPESLRSILFDRISSPLFAAFFVSLLGVNAQAILVVFSDIPVFTKIHHLQYEIYKDEVDVFIRLFFVPSISTFLMLYIYPWFANRVYEHTQTNRQKLVNIKVKIEDETPLTIEQSKKIKQETMQKGIYYLKHGNYEYPITYQLIKDGRKNRVLNKKINLNIPITLFHGLKDEVVPLMFSKKILKIFPKAKKKLIKIKNGNHSLSKKNDLKKICKELDCIIRLF
mgnify:CR=1 FL=1